MAYGLIYRGEWTMMDDTTTVRVDISDTTVDDSLGVTIKTLQMGQNPLVISVVNNDKNKLVPIRSKQAKIEIKTANTIDIDTFTQGADNRFYVEITVNGSQTLFLGFLVTADLSQPFYANPETLTLTASDCLGLLKNVPLTDFNDDVPVGKFKLGKFIAYCLNKTGLDLDIYVVNNLRHFTETAQPGHFYETIFVDSKTFEKQIQECEDCYSSLEKILKYDCFITQYNGAWWIIRVDEYDENLIYVSIFDSLGDWQSDEPATTYNKSIGSAQSLRFADYNQLLGRDMAHNYNKLTYRYEQPLEVPCNSDFTRGDYVSDLPNETINGETYTVKKYNIDCWTMKRGTPITPASPTVTPYIKRFFNDLDYEEIRYIVIPDGSDFSNREYLESEPIELSVQDRFTFSIDWQSTTDIVMGAGFDSFFSVMVLHGDDGNWYKLGHDGLAGSGDWEEENARWLNTSGFTANQLAGFLNWDSDTFDETRWHTQTWEAPGVPVSGKLYIWLYPFGNPSNNYEVHFSNLSFTYYGYINGSHRKYIGQSQKMTRVASGYRTSLEDQVYVSDSPKKLFKGALFYDNGGVYSLTQTFYPHNVFPSGPPSNIYCHPYGELQIKSVWNQNVYRNWVIDGSVYGVAGSWPDLIHKYIFTDNHASTTDRYYLLVGFSQNWKTGIMDSTFIEVFDRVLLKTYSDTHEFKYISE